MINRRSFIKSTAVVSLGSMISSQASASVLLQESPKYSLPPLPYAYDALEPYIDKQTMELHHTKHHQAYIDKINAQLEGKVLQRLMSPETFCKTLTADQTILRNNVGGHYNHSLFWTLMKPNGGGQPEGAFMSAILESYGTFEKFKESFSGTAKQLFGSGWTWLVVTPEKKLFIGNTINQDNPLMQFNSFSGQPVLALDVWEHAYYLKYQNKRADYIQNWWNLVNWEAASALFTNAIK